MYWAVVGAFVAFEQTLGLFLSWSVSLSRPSPACPEDTQASLLLGIENHLIVHLASSDTGSFPSHIPPSFFTPPL